MKLVIVNGLGLGQRKAGCCHYHIQGFYCPLISYCALVWLLPAKYGSVMAVRGNGLGPGRDLSHCTACAARSGEAKYFNYRNKNIFVAENIYFYWPRVPWSVLSTWMNIDSNVQKELQEKTLQEDMQRYANKSWTRRSLFVQRTLVIISIFILPASLKLS